MGDYICLVRTLLAGYWNTHRIVYSFMPETIDFMEKELKIQDFCLSIQDLQESAANEPILIELPSGYPIRKAFFGRISFFNEATTKSFARRTVDYCLFSCLMRKDDTAILISAADDIDVDVAITLCIFKHILTILQRKALRKMNSSGQPSPPNPHLPGKKLPIPSAPIIRQGGDISDIVPIAMYDLTKRAVKRVPRKEEARRSGWKMTPHTRRRHPHRYWVGSGENRRQEIRWLESIHINKQSEDAVPAVTVHEVK